MWPASLAWLSRSAIAFAVQVSWEAWCWQRAVQSPPAPAGQPLPAASLLLPPRPTPAGNPVDSVDYGAMVGATNEEAAPTGRIVSGAEERA
jgi:hypothetical protein